MAKDSTLAHKSFPDFSKSARRHPKHPWSHLVTDDSPDTHPSSPTHSRKSPPVFDMYRQPLADFARDAPGKTATVSCLRTLQVYLFRRYAGGRT